MTLEVNRTGLDGNVKSHHHSSRWFDWGLSFPTTVEIAVEPLREEEAFVNPIIVDKQEAKYDENALDLYPMIQLVVSKIKIILKYKLKKKIK